MRLLFNLKQKNTALSAKYCLKWKALTFLNCQGLNALISSPHQKPGKIPLQIKYF